MTVLIVLAVVAFLGLAYPKRPACWNGETDIDDDDEDLT